MGLFSRRFKAQQLKTSDEFASAVASGKPVFVDFWKSDCQPCRTMDGIVDEIAEEFQDDAVVLKAGLEHVPDLFEKFKVRSTPTFVLVTPTNDGLHMRFRHSGLIKKDQLVNEIQGAVAKG